MFTWEPVNPASVCSSLYYEPLTNCSNCITASGSANCSISMITSIAKICSFAIRPVVCGNIVGNKSETVNIILKGLNIGLSACMSVCIASYFHTVIKPMPCTRYTLGNNCIAI